ncbi:MAG: hypothetical protein DSO02_06315, partial [Hadesarchaea archaeon]
MEKVAEKMGKVKGRYGLEGCPVVVTGVGRKIVGREAALRAGFKKVVDLGRIWGEEAALMTPAFSMGKLVEEVV